MNFISLIFKAFGWMNVLIDLIKAAEKLSDNSVTGADKEAAVVQVFKSALAKVGIVITDSMEKVLRAGIALIVQVFNQQQIPEFMSVNRGSFDAKALVRAIEIDVEPDIEDDPDLKAFIEATKHLEGKGDPNAV